MNRPVARLNEQPHALYRFYDRSQVLLYVGITVSLPTRLTSHRTKKPWWTLIHHVDVEHFATRDEALAAERTAIRAEKPLYNIVHNDTGLDSYNVQTTDEKIAQLRPDERDIIAAPAYDEGMSDLAETILDFVYDDESMKDIQRRASWRSPEEGYPNEKINHAIAAMEQAIDRVISLENALVHLLHAFPLEQQAADREIARRDVVEHMGDEHTDIDILCRAAYYTQGHIYADYFDDLSLPEQTEWRVCAAAGIGPSANSSDLRVRAVAGRMAKNYAEHGGALHGMCIAEEGDWATCPRKAKFRVWLVNCDRCSDVPLEGCRGHDAFCAEHREQAFAGTLAERAFTSLQSMLLMIDRIEEIRKTDPWAPEEVAN